MFHLIVKDTKSQPLDSDHNFWWEGRAEADSNRRPSAYQPNALPIGQTGSAQRDNHAVPLVDFQVYTLGLCCYFVFVRLSSA